MGLFDKFPYTDYHGLNMDWILGKIKKFESDIQGVLDQIDAIYKLYPQLVSQISELKIQLRDIETKFDALISDINFKLTTFATKAELEQKITDAMKQWEVNILTLKTDVKLLYSYIDVEIGKLNRHMEERLQGFQEQIDNITLEPVQEVISPVTRLRVSVQQALNDLYYNLYYTLNNVWGLEAQEYDYLFLTAKQYDDHGLTALQYDLVAKWYLYPWHYHVEWPMGLESQEYDELELDASIYDGIELTAKRYDTLARWYLGPYPFETVDGTQIKSKLY